MLKEIRCDKFIESKIEFSKGLNSILGDNFSTNSIGKSTFLMILDFTFGGNTFLTKNSGSIKELGDLTFFFAFEFGNSKSYFSRNTEYPEVISNCDENYNILSDITLKDYCTLLKSKYSIENEFISFRDTISLFSRIWGKDNYSVDKPLLSFLKEPDYVSINRLVKLFGFYNEIKETESSLKDKQESKSALNKATKKSYLPKITKSVFEKNKVAIENKNRDIEDIQNNILKFTLNIEELTNKEVLELKTDKSKLLKEQSIVLNKINRLELSLGEKSIKSKHLQKLSSFFDNPNEDKIQNIEAFHNKISSILSRELTTTKKILEDENELFIARLSEIDSKISNLLENVSSPKYIVEKIYDLTIESNKLINENKFYQEKIDVTETVKKLEIDLDDIISNVLIKIEDLINEELVNINNLIHTKEKKVPRIKLNRKSYTFDHSTNTGTGKSYSDLIEFDLTILKLTDLPFVIHDSVLFKNIEDIAVDKIIEQYMKTDKQIFISLDGINKFSDSSQDNLINSKVLDLSKTRKLFNKDWS
jgi:hypothetical protein